VEKRLGRRVKLDTLVTAIRRVRIGFKPPEGRVGQVIGKSVINLRTDVAKVSVEKSRRTMEIVRQTLAEFRGEFLEVLEGITSITFIVDGGSFEEVLGQFRRDEVLDHRTGLAALMVQSPPEIVDSPGCISAFYNLLARMRVNIEETVSCYTETILVLRMEDVGRAVAALTEMITEARA